MNLSKMFAEKAEEGGKRQIFFSSHIGRHQLESIWLVSLPDRRGKGRENKTQVAQFSNKDDCCLEE